VRVVVVMPMPMPMLVFRLFHGVAISPTSTAPIIQGQSFWVSLASSLKWVSEPWTYLSRKNPIHHYQNIEMVPLALKQKARP